MLAIDQAEVFGVQRKFDLIWRPFMHDQGPKQSSRRDRNGRLRLLKVKGSAGLQEPPGSMPVAVMTAAAPGEARNLNNTMAASGSLYPPL